MPNAAKMGEEMAGGDEHLKNEMIWRKADYLSQMKETCKKAKPLRPHLIFTAPNWPTSSLVETARLLGDQG